MTKRSASAGPPRGLSAALAAAGLLTVAVAVRAQEAPTGLDPTLPQVMTLRHGVIEGGSPEIGADGKAMTIRQSTLALKLDWQRFDIGQGHAVKFEQPDKDAFVVNRVIGEASSRIDGALTANGRVYVINPKGVLFGKEASVDLGGLVARASALPDAEMTRALPPPQLDSSQGTSDIENAGRIVIRNGGLARMEGVGVRLLEGSRIEASGGVVELLGKRIEMKNGATVRALEGSVLFRGEEQITLGKVITHDLTLIVPLTGEYHAKDKSYDGTSHGEVEPGGRVVGVDFTADSSLAMSYRFGNAEPGRPRVEPDVQFREWRGRVRTEGDIGFPATAYATIKPLSPSAHRRIYLPVFEKATAGKVDIGDPVGRSLTIRQTTPFALIDWKSFNVAEDNQVRFEQPDAKALVVNRVAGEASRIHGRIEANGDVFLINPNGITFGQQAQVEAGGLVAAALTSTDGTWSVRPLSPALQGSGAASVNNQGEITIAQGGVATLAASGEVVQAGRITAPEGAIHLASTERVTLDRAGRIQTVDGARQRIGHTGTSSAEDGDIAMFGGESGEVAGVVRATGEGKIRLDGNDPSWVLSGDVQPGAGLLLSEVVLQLNPHSGVRGALAPVRVEQWLNAGADVELRLTARRTLFGNGEAIVAREDARGTLTLAANRLLDLGVVRVPKLRLPRPVHVSFDAKDKPFDGTVAARADNWGSRSITPNSGSNLKLRPTFRFASAEPGRHLVSATIELTGFHGDDAWPLDVVYTNTPQDLARRTASILPAVKPIEPEIKPIEPEIKPTVPEIKPTLPEVTPTVPEIKPTVPDVKPTLPEVTPTVPEIKPTPPTSPARVKRPLAVRRAVACEARRDVVRALDCDAATSAPIAPAASARVLMDRGIRAPR